MTARVAKLEGKPLWAPSAEAIANTHLTAFTRAAEAATGRRFADYHALHAWSIEQPGEFWPALWDYCGVVGSRGQHVVDDPDKMPGAKWFAQARLNFAENLLQPRAGAGEDALVFWGEDKVKRRLGHAQLTAQVAALAAALKAQGVRAGDRVAAYLPNMPETIIAMLATASIGAVFTSASPDFGVQGVLDRFGQTQPKLLFAVDGYWYAGKRVDCLGKLTEIAAALPSVEGVVVVPYLDVAPNIGAIGKAITWGEFCAPFVAASVPEFARLPFDHPLYVMYSSGTTGVPKCIVHGAGGSLLQHLKEQQLHSDLHVGDRLFYFTTCGWMMWNWLASGLASGATLLLYDGSPFVGDGAVLWDFSESERCTHFGTSAKYLDALSKTELKPRERYDLGALRAVLSTGSPLAPEGFDFVYRDIKGDAQLSSISGGTDIMGCFVLGNPNLPVWRGEIQCKGLGMAVQVWDEYGRPVDQEKGELVCTRAFPSMPTGFWNDPDGGKYRAAYFERFPGVWCHGDFCEITAHDGVIIYGRSDATLNPGGVRIGTAEIYRQVEKLPEVLESIAIGQDWPPGRSGDVRVVLFVRLRAGLRLDSALVDRIKRAIRENATPRHVPAVVVEVTDIPRTKSGKIVELAVRNVVHGRPVRNVEALANPESLQQFANRSELSV